MKMVKKVNENSMKGFTLIEVVIAVAIISIGFFGVYSLHLQTIKANQAIRFHLKAPMLATMKIAEIDSSSELIVKSSGDFGEDNSGYSWNLTPGEIENEELDSVGKDLVQYDLEISNANSSYLIMVCRFLNQRTDK